MTMRSSLIIGDRETDPNDYANNLLLPLSLAVGVMLTARRRTAQMLAGAVAAIIMTAIILTMSRGGLLSVFAMAIVYLYRFRLRMKALIPVAVMALLLMAAPSLFFQRLFSAVDSGGAGRTDIWKAGFVAFQHYPIFGAGLGNFPAAFDRFAGEAPRFEGYGRGSHNIYLGVSVELGIIGLLLLLLALRQQLRGRQFSSVPSPWHAAIACEAAAPSPFPPPLGDACRRVLSRYHVEERILVCLDHAGGGGTLSAESHSAFRPDTGARA